MCIIYNINKGFGGFVAELFGYCTVRCDFRRKCVKFFLVVWEAEILSFLVTLVSIFVVYLDSNLDSSSSVLLLLNSNDSGIVPTSKGIDNVNMITNLDVFSPFEGGAFWLVRCQVVWIVLYFDGWKFVIQIVRNKNMGLGQFDNSTMSPKILLVWSRKLKDINFAAFLQKHFEIVMLFGKVQIWLKITDKIRILCDRSDC